MINNENKTVINNIISDSFLKHLNFCFDDLSAQQKLYVKNTISKTLGIKFEISNEHQLLNTEVEDFFTTSRFVAVKSDKNLNDFFEKIDMNKLLNNDYLPKNLKTETITNVPDYIKKSNAQKGTWEIFDFNKKKNITSEFELNFIKEIINSDLNVDFVKIRNNEQFNIEKNKNTKTLYLNSEDNLLKVMKSNEYKNLSNEKVFDLTQEEQIRKSNIKNKLLDSWNQVNVLNTNLIKQHQEDYKSLNLATNIEDIIAIENKFNVNLPIKELNLKDIQNNENVYIFDYVVKKKYPNNKNLIFEENQKEILRRNNVYNSELNTTQLKHIYKHCDLIYKDNQLIVDLNSYDKNNVKNDMDFAVIQNLETKLNKDFSKEESKNLLLLSSHKNEDKVVVNVNELKNNINDYLEAKEQNLIADALIDHKITSKEKREIENFENEKNEIIGGI